MNWQVVATITAPVLALLIGAWLNRRLERRPKLISFLTHAASIPVQPPGGAPFHVHTHTVVVRNAGNAAANNVRLSHAVLPLHYSVFPSVAFNIEQLPSGGADIVFPNLVAGEQISVTYLYQPPLLFSQVNTNAKSDEGFARIVTVLWSPQVSHWQHRGGVALMVVGTIALLYGVLELGMWIWAQAMGA